MSTPVQLQLASMTSFMVFGLLSLHGLPGNIQVPLSTVANGLKLHAAGFIQPNTGATVLL